MYMKNGIRTLLAFCAVVGSVHAQTLETFKSKLSAPGESSGRVRVTEHGVAASAIKSLQVQPTGEKVRGYRVRIFFDNSQNARALANDAIARFKSLYPAIPAYLVYENPYFKVTVGNCLSIEEANILVGGIKGAFDRAFPVREEIPLSLFGESAESAPAEGSETDRADK